MPVYHYLMKGGLLIDKRFKLLKDLLAACNPALSPKDITIFKNDQCGNGVDVVQLGVVRAFVNIQFKYGCLITNLFFYFMKDGRH